MKNIIFKISFLIVGVLMFSSCEKNEIPQIDVQNARAIAGFGGVANQTAVFDPSQDTQTTFTVGVSTLSSTDRRVQIRVADASTLDPSFYTISTLTPVIPAGAFTTDVVVTTNGNLGVPPGGSALVLELVSVEDAEILDGSTQTLNVNLEVKCPSVDLALVPGTYDITALTFAGFFGESDFDREIVAGPGENQFTVVGGAYIVEGGEDLIFTVDPETGDIIALDETKIASTVSFGPNTYRFLPGGRVLTCAGIVEINFDFGGNIAGNPNSFKLLKQ